MASGEHYKAIPRTHEKSITLADTPYTLTLGYNQVKVDTTGGNVRVNLPDTNYPIDVIKTSSDAYIVTVWVSGTQIGEVAGELSKITVENAEVTKDEPWFPYDAIVGIAGISGDGGEVLAKDRFGRVIAGGRGVAGTDDVAVINAAAVFAEGKHISLLPGTYNVLSGQTILIPSRYNVLDRTELEGLGHVRIQAAPGVTTCIKNANSSSGVSCIDQRIKLKNLYVTGPNTGVGIKNDYINSLHLEKMLIAHFDIGVEQVGGWSQYILGESIISSNVSYGMLVHDEAQGGSHVYDSAFEANGIHVGYVAGAANEVKNCHMEGATTIGISLGGTSYSTFSGNYIYTGVTGIGGGCTQCTVSDNMLIAQSQFGIFLDYATYSAIDSNSVYSADVSSYRVSNSSNVNILNNISRTPLVRDLWLIANSGIRMKNNMFVTGSKTISTTTFFDSNTGSSTGTGSEQTITHGLLAIPVGCKAWITYLVGTRYVTEMIPFDATNVYPTVATGTAYNWRIE